MATKISAGTVIAIETVVSGIDQEFIPEGTAPVISGVESSYTIGSEQIISIVASAYDAEGDDITWSYSTSGDLGGTTVTQNDNIFTVTGGQQDATFTITVTATDSAGWVVESTTTAYYDYLEPPEADGNNFFIFATNDDANNGSNMGSLTAYDDAGQEIYKIAAPQRYWGGGSAKNTSSLFISNNAYGGYKGRIWKYDLVSGGNPTVFIDNSSGNQWDMIGSHMSANDTYLVLVNGHPSFGMDLKVFEISTGIEHASIDLPSWNTTGYGDKVVVHDNKIYLGDSKYNSRSGAIHVYDMELNLLNTITHPSPSSAGSIPQFGTNIAIDNDKVYSCASLEKVNGIDYVGAVHVFNLSDYSYSHTISHPSPVSSANFGNVLQAGNGYVAIGAPGQDISVIGNDVGGAWLFNSNGTLLSELVFPTGFGNRSGSYWGRSVAIAGDRVAVGSPESNNNDGFVSVFDTNGTLLNNIELPGDKSEIYGFGIRMFGQTN